VPIILETARLVMREWRTEDFDPFHAMNRDPYVRQFYADHNSVQQSRDFLARAKERDLRDGYFFQPIIEKASNSFIGYVGLSKIDFEAAFTGSTEIGWTLRHDNWGKGYATEMAGALIDHAFAVLELAEVIAFTVPINARSRRVMEKLGMNHEEDEGFEHPMVPEGHPYRFQVLYRKRRTAGGVPVTKTAA